MDKPSTAIMFNLKDWTDLLKNILTCIGILVGGGWTLWRFWLSRDRYSKMEFYFDIAYVGKLKDFHLLELQATVTNKGFRSQGLFKFNLKIEGYTEDEKGGGLTDTKGNIKFNRLIQNEVDWLEDSNIVTIVDGNTSNKFTFLARIPADVEYVSVFSKLKLSKHMDGDSLDFRRNCCIKEGQLRNILNGKTE